MEGLMIGTVCITLARQKREFQSVIDDFFEYLNESEGQKNNFVWRCVKSYYNAIKNDLDKIWSLRMFCAFVFKLFCRFYCEDHQLITKIIYIYHEVLNKYETLSVCAVCMLLNNPQHHIYEDYISTRSILSKVNKITANTYRFTNRELYSKLTIGAICEGDYIFLKFLVKHGLSYCPDNELGEAKFHLKRLFTLYCDLKGHRRNDSENDTFVESVLKQLFDEETPNLKRISLILVCIIRTLDKRLGNNYYPDYVRCLNLYALTLSETVISLKNVKDFVSLAFTDDGAFISETCSCVQEIFPEYPSLSSPRTLKYLCRYTVRKFIVKLPSLPAVISGLQIPEEVKAYLLISSR